MSARAWLCAVVVGAVLVGAGAVGTALVRGEDVPADLRSAVAPSSASTSRQDFTDERTVQATFLVSDPLSLRLRAGGTVTGSRCTPGRVISSGDVVARIDDRPIVVLHTATPVYRDLRKGLKGADVRAVQKELSRLGYRVPTGGTMDVATVRAVKAFQKDRRDPSPNGALALDHVVWLPSRVVRPAKCALSLGAVVAPGDELAQVNGRITAVRLKSVPDDLVPGARIIQVFGVTGALRADRTATGGPFLAAVAATAEYQALVAAPSPDPTPVTIALAKPLSTVKVPPAAVFAQQGTHGCIESGTRMYPVEVVGSGLGTSLVTVAGDPPDTVDLGSAITSTSCR